MSIIQGTSKAAGGAVYEIDQSIRFNFSDAAHLLRTPSTASNRRTWTWSLWVKRSGLGNPGGPNQVHMLFGVGAGSCLRFTPSDELRLETPAGSHTFVTSQVFRDTSAWYHIVLAFDSTQATDTDRRKLYVNGSQVTDFSSTTFTGLAQNAEWDINSTSQHQIAKSNLADYFGGYLAELNFVDGQALAPTDFGETNADTGQWVPVRYTGSYGSNGFYITGADSADLGADESGNSNDFTSSGLTAADQVTDSPTLNKATLNGVNLYTSGSVLSDGNLTVTNSGTSGFWRRAYATQALSYKTYWEVHADNLGSLNIGLSSLKNPNGGINNPVGNFGAGIQNNEAFVAGSYANESGGSRTFPISTGNYIMFAFDPDRGALWAGTEGTWKDGTASSASSATILAEIEGTGTSYALFTGIDADDAIPHIAQYSTSTATARFSSEDWEGTAPTGYEQLAPSLLPDPTIADPSAHMQTTLYTGTGSSLAVTQSGNSTFQPDWVWIKGRSGATEHVLTDAVRGVTKELSSNDTGAEETVAQGLTAFDSAGFTVGTDGSYNTSSATYVGWQWKANGAGSSNTDGATTSTVSANTTSGFSIVKWTGTGANTTLGHGLGVAPKMILVKNTGAADSWVVYHEDVGATKGLTLDTTATPTTASTFFNNTAPTSSVFSVGSGGRTNQSTKIMIAYCFGEVENFSKISSFEGNSNADGSFVYTGFTPAFILTKNIDTADQWGIRDATRNPFNVTDKLLNPNASTAETSATSGYIDILSNGFKARSSDSNINSSTLIYMAFAESPFQTATAR
jgi:hypothetical protein